MFVRGATVTKGGGAYRDDACGSSGDTQRHVIHAAVESESKIVFLSPTFC